MMWTKSRELVQITDISGDGLNLWLGQGVGNWLHDGRCIGFFRILTPLFGKVRQFIDDVVIELTRQTRKLVIALGLGTVTGSACRNVGSGNSLLIDCLSPARKFLWSAPEWRGIESPKIRGKSRYHIWA
jgi:hypothetical protein